MRDIILAAFPGPGVDPELTDEALHWLNQAKFLKQDPEKLRTAAVLIPLIDRPGGMTVLLTQRTSHLKAHAGQIAFPGGRAHPDDDSPESTALRETHEEIGVPPDRVTLIGRLHERVTGTGFRVVPIVGLIEPPVTIVPEPGEVAAVFEVPLSFILDPANHRSEMRLEQGIEREFLFVPYEDFNIWGLTARLLINLSERLRV